MIKELIEKRARALNVMKDLSKKCVDESREMSQDEKKQWDAADADFNSLTEQIQVQERMKKVEAQVANEERTTIPAETPQPTAQPGNKKTKEERYRATFRKFLANGIVDLTPEERSIMAEHRGTATITTATSGLQGGYTIPAEFSNELERTMALFGGMIEASRTIRTASGGTLDWPTVDDTGTSGEWMTEGNAVTVADMTFNRKQYSAFTLATLVKSTLEFLNDQAVNIESELAIMIGERLGRALNLALTTGDGSGKPTGVVTDATVGKTAASATAITAPELVDLIHSVDPLYRTGPKVGFQFSDATLAAVKKLQLGAGDASPLWVPSMREGEPDRVWGYQYWINQDVADIAASAKSVLFGDFSKYIVRRVAQGDGVIRLNERYMDALTVGFISFIRVDGKLLNTAAIKVLQQASS